MNRPAIPVWLIPCIAVTALVSGYSIFTRHQVESRNKAVTLAAEYETIESLAAGSGQPVDSVLSDLKAQGLGAVVLSEETIGELASEGYAAVSGNEVVLKQDRIVSSARTLEALQQRLERGLRARFPKVKIMKGLESGESATRVDFVGPSLIRQTSIGINPSVAQLVIGQKLGIICRMSNPTGVSSQYVRQTLTWAHELGASVFLPQGDQVLGRRDSLAATEETLKALGMLYATPEFSKIGGDANIVGSAPEMILRLHAAQTAELDKMPYEDAVDRYAKAARERNMRILLIRPITAASDDPVHSFGEFLKRINDQIRKEGGDMGVARPFEAPVIPIAVFILIAISVAPVAFFAAESISGNRNFAIVVAVLFGLLGLAAITGMGRSLAALGAALVFPITAFVVLDARKGKNLLLEFLIVSAISIVGGLAVAGLLNALPYFVKAQEFRGIKVAVFLPIFVVAWYLAKRHLDLKTAIKNPITWGAAALSLFILGGLMFMNSRTGNDNPAGVSDLELKFRSILDAVMFVRPRTKSFLIGHPFLFVGIGLLLHYRLKPSSQLAIATVLCLTVGAIGQTDIVNTLCHIHTPVALSLTRDALGVIPGCIIGFVLWTLVRRIWLKGEGEIHG